MKQKADKEKGNKKADRNPINIMLKEMRSWMGNRDMISFTNVLIQYPFDTNVTLG